MPTAPHETLLDRSSAAAEMDTRFAPQLLLLEDMANYGSHLILRVLDRSPEKTLRNLIVGASLLKQFVAMLDATAVARDPRAPTMHVGVGVYHYQGAEAT